MNPRKGIKTAKRVDIFKSYTDALPEGNESSEGD